MQTLLQPAFVLHSRPYRETSLLVELFTEDCGRVAVVARGIRKARSKTAALLQPFMPLLVSWFGKGELVTLSQVEAKGFIGLLRGKNLHCGLYLNELLLRLLPKHDAHAPLFAIYQQTLVQLQESASEKHLRLFEKKLLEEIGYGLPLKNAQEFTETASYRFDHELGFLACEEGKSLPGVFSGRILNALLHEHFEDSQVLAEIKRLMRFVFSALLGNRPLQSRRLFQFQKEAENHAY